MYHTKIGGTMEDFFDKLQDKILIIDYSGKILFCNKTLLNQLQYQLDDLDNIYNLIINSNIKFNTIDINCNKEYIVDILTKNNSTIPFKLNLSFSSFNNSDSIFILLRDITSNYLLSENLENEFFANISHEFKTPLNIILISLQVIGQNLNNNNIIIANDFNFNKYTASIKQNSYRLLRLANNLIDITKIDTGHYEIHKKNCNIISIIEDITLSVAQYVNYKNIELLFDTTVEELIICCDPDKIERIMLNLLSNAIKYTNSNGTINVNIDTTDTNVIISVKDTGIGISKENQSIIFERFMQVDDTLTRKCEGSGIGLSLVKSLVEMHGGKIAVYSIEGIGSEFTFTLPKAVIPNSKIIYDIDDTSHSKVEKCNIEFSDIYAI